MAVDLAVATPTFLDLTFHGLEEMPLLGQERFASDLRRSPGGGAITAIAASRLGLTSALAAPLADDVAGELVMSVLREANVAIVDRRSTRTPVTVVMPVSGDRAMVTVDHGVRASAADVAALEPRAVALNLDLLYVIPTGVPGYVSCGDDDARAFAGRPPAQLCDVRALFLSESEALMLSGMDELDAAMSQLSEKTPNLVVTRGPQGAAAVIDGRRYDVPAHDAGPVVDPTGAGDLVLAAYVWADLHGAEPEERLRWAMVYAGLSVTISTAVGGAVDEARLLDEGAKLGLTAPSGAQAGRSA